MPFKGLEDRFKERAHGIYRKYSTKDGSEHHPYMEWKPDERAATETANDSRMLPIGSTKRDAIRMGKFSISKDGVMFLVKQEVQQLGNTFSETRVINPLFVIANTVPYLHIKRSLAVPSQFSVTGNSAHKSPASDPQIGSAGRLQKETSSKTIASLMGIGGRNNILSYIPTNGIIDAARGLFSLANKGSLGIDERPELNFNGTYFSIAVWNGFRKSYGFRDSLDVAAANLRTGNWRGARDSIRNSANEIGRQVNTILGRGGIIPRNNIIPDGRNGPHSNLEGRRYFITSNDDADRYLRNSITFSTNSDGREHTSARLSFLSRQPYVLSEAVRRVTVVEQPSLSRRVAPITNNISGLSKPYLPNGQAFNSEAKTKEAIGKVKHGLITGDINADNPAEDALLFNGISLKSRYESDERLEFIRTQLIAQKESATSYWEENRANLGFLSEGYTPGEDLSIDPKIRYFPYGSGFMRDQMNIVNGAFSVTEGEPTDDDISRISRNMSGASDSINVWFYDLSTNEIIPFRAFISGLNETVTPEYNDVRYVGRTERNIVYTGVTRDISFALNIHAFSDEELKNVWKKAERLTGLCYPGDYNQGFMVPPFTKITIGNLYYNQPCYIKSISHTIEDGVSWETLDGLQVPHGVTIALSLSIIEKTQKKSGSHFFNITERTT